MVAGKRRGQQGEGFGARWVRPNVSVFGYAIYLAITATSLWGGVFPFFPEEFRTVPVTLSFVIAQAASFLIMFLVSMMCAYWGSRVYPRTLPVGSAFCSFIGSALLIAALYLGDWQVVLVVAAGIFLGAGREVRTESAQWPRQ